MPIPSLRLLLAAAALCCVPAIAADAPPPIDFTPEERAYLEHAPPISLCVDPDWMPFERIDAAGRHEGIAADLIRLVAGRVGLRIELLPTAHWEESLAASRAGRCRVVSFLNRTPERERWLIFTEPLFLDQNIIITREEHPYIGDPHGLAEATVALPRGTMVEERIRRDYPNLRVIPTDSENEAVELVSSRRADMTIRSLIVAAYAIRQEGLFNLKISGQIPEFTNRLAIGVARDQDVLRDILDKGVHSVTPQEREAIVNRHVAIRVQQGIDYTLVWQVLAVSALITLLILYWNRKLRAMNRELERLSVTDRLTGLFNRMKLDAELASELERSRRFGQPFAVILLDLDEFKRVNDTYGHPVGDRVLIDVARILADNTRRTDLVARWGGEEFMILCPQADPAGAAILAENLRRRIGEHAFPTAGRRSASFGVTAYRPGDEARDLVTRADEALYEAKRRGRDRVEQR